MATLELFEKWVVGGAWEFTQPVSVDTNGVLTVDADAHGVTSFYPCLANARYAFCCATHMDYALRDVPRIYEFPVTFTTAGTLTVGFSVHPSMAASHTHKYEFNFDGANIRAYARGSSVFDHTMVLVGNKCRIRVGFSRRQQRVALCDWNGTLIEIDAQRDHYLASDYGSTYSEPPNRAFYMIGGNYASPDSTVFLTLQNGSATLDPVRILTDLATDGFGAVSTGTTAGVRTKPASPTLGVTQYQNGLNKVTMTAPDTSTFIMMTRNRGMFATDGYSIIEDTQRIGSESAAGSSTGLLNKNFTTNRPSVFRAITHNGIPSDITTTYVGPTTDVAIPEISIGRFSAKRTDSATVHMYCSDSAASIRFTVDGTEPTATSYLYTEPLFVKDSAFIRAKSFKGGNSSVTVNATFINNGLSIPNPYDPSLWVYNGNATITGSSVVVNDPTGIGVSFREDAYEASSYAVLNNSSNTFNYTASFDVSGPFRLKVPGTDKHLAWVGNAIDLVADTSTAPVTSMNSAVRAYVVLTGNGTGALGQNKAVVTGYDAGGTVVTTRTFTYVTQPYGEYTNILGFTSEGISAFTLTNISLKILSSSTATLDSGTPLIDSASAHNICGATAPAALTQDTTSMATWDIVRNWPLEYKGNVSWKVEKVSNFENGWRSTNLLATDNIVKAYYPGTAADSQTAWFTARRFYGYFNVALLGTFSFGWSSQNPATVPAIKVAKAPGVSMEMDTMGAVGGSQPIRLINAPADLSTEGTTILPSVKHDLLWRCGRKVVSGRLLTRTVLLDDGPDPQYAPILNNIVYDTGWIDTGAAPAVLPRPMMLVRGSLLSVSGDPEPIDLSQTQATVQSGMTEAELDSCMTLGAISSLPTPTLLVGAQASDGTFPVTATCAGASSVVVCAGNRPLSVLGSSAANRWSISSGSSVSVPELSTVQAIGIGSGTTVFSPVGSTYVGLDTSDYISVTTRPGTALIRILPRAKAYKPSASANETLWSLWLNGIRSYELDLSLPGDIELILEGGSYSAVLCREIRSGRNAGVVGTTPTPIVFSVPDVLDISLVVPSTVVAGEALSIAGGATLPGVTWAWSFSDGTTASVSNPSVTFAKPGKYRWNVVVTSPTGDIAQQSGTVIATFAPGLTIPTTRTVSTQERVS